MTAVDGQRTAPAATRGRADSWGQDMRSVGELLRDADRLARDLLLDLGPDDAPGLLRAWGETVQSARDLWRAMPVPGYTRDGRLDADVMDRLDTHAQQMHRSQLRAGWPGPGPDDERLLRIAETFTRACDLVERFHRPVAQPGRRETARADTAAARMRVVHALHVAGHGVLVAVRHHLDAETRRTAGPRDLKTTRAIPRSLEARRRLEVFERLVGAYVGGRYVAAVSGEHRPPLEEHDRLRTALVAWDIHTHRVLAYDPTPANVALLARTQAYLMTTTSVLLNAAASAGDLPAEQTSRCVPALEAAQTAWADVATSWGRLAGPGPIRSDRELLAAADEVRAALVEVTHGGSTLATPTLIAARVDLPEVVHVLQQASAAAVDLAHVLRDASEDLQLQVPARAALVAFTASAQAAPDEYPWRRGEPEPLASPVDPRALLCNENVALPGPVKTHLQVTVGSALSGASAAMAATTAFDLVQRVVS